MLAFDVYKCLLLPFAFAIPLLLPSHTIKSSTESGTFQAFLQPLLFHRFFISTLADSLIESWNVPSAVLCLLANQRPLCQATAPCSLEVQP
jgi:hypothetical protein